MALDQGFAPPGQRDSNLPQLNGSPFDFNIGSNFNSVNDDPWSREQRSLNFNGIEEGAKRRKVSSGVDPSEFLLNESFYNGWNTNYARGYPTNRHVNQRYLVKGFIRDFMNIQQKEQLVFINKRTKTQTRDYAYNGMDSSQWGEASGYSYGGDKERDSVLGLPGINYLYASAEKYPSDSNNVLTAQDVLEFWTLAGVVRTEDGYKTRLNDQTNSRERILNIAVGGPVQTYMGWPGILTSSTTLYLILKKRPAVDNFVLNVLTQEVRRTAASRGPGGLSTHPFGFSFWASGKHKSPPDRELIYYDEYNIKHRGIALYVGLVEKNTINHNSLADASHVSTNITALTLQTKSSIIVDIS